MNATAEKTLDQYEAFLFEGVEQWKAHPVKNDEGEVEFYSVVFMDVEYDPIRVTIDLDGIVTMPDDDNEYARMNSDMLFKLAEIAANIQDNE